MYSDVKAKGKHLCRFNYRFTDPVLDTDGTTPSWQAMNLAVVLNFFLSHLTPSALTVPISSTLEKRPCLFPLMTTSWPIPAAPEHLLALAAFYPTQQLVDWFSHDPSCCRLWLECNVNALPWLNWGPRWLILVDLPYLGLQLTVLAFLSFIIPSWFLPWGLHVSCSLWNVFVLYFPNPSILSNVIS